MARKIITVFGGGGFIGRYLVRFLAKDDWIIRIAQRQPNDALFLKPAGDIGQIDLVQADIGDMESVAKALKGSQAAVNLVGILAQSGTQRFQKIHGEGAAHIARIAAELKLQHLTHISAIGADSHSPSLYARSKAKGEEEVLRHFPGTTILRPSIVIGPEDQFFNRFARMARISPFLPLIGGGKTKFQPTYVEDLAEAILRTLYREEAKGRIYELGGPGQYSFRDLMRRMLAETGMRRVLLPIPYCIAFPLAFFLQMLPGAPLTIDQVRLLKSDNIVSGKYPGYAELGIEPNALTHTILSYLSIYRTGKIQEQK